jgi:hypothetical protein
VSHNLQAAIYISLQHATCSSTIACREGCICSGEWVKDKDVKGNLSSSRDAESNARKE